MTRIFEQTEMTKTILEALKSFSKKGRIIIDCPSNGRINLLQTYDDSIVDKCQKLINNIEDNKLDVRLSNREE